MDNRLGYTSPVADVLITRDAEYILANNIQAHWVREDQTPDFEVDPSLWDLAPLGLASLLPGRSKQS